MIRLVELFPQKQGWYMLASC